MTSGESPQSSGEKSPGKSRQVEGALWWIIALLSTIMLGVLLIYQAYAPDLQSRYQTHQPLTVTDNSASQSLTMTLMVIYPEELLLEESSKPGRPIQVWLSDPNRSNAPLTYTVTFEPLADGLVFTDKNGTPVTPSAVLSATEFPFESGSWFLHRTPGVATQPISVDLKPSVLTSDGTKLDIDPATISVELETSWSAFWRNFLNVACGNPVIPFLGFALSLTIWLWNRGEERRKQDEVRKQKDNQERRAFQGEITRLESLSVTNPTEAVRGYLVLCRAAREDQQAEALVQKCNQERWQALIAQEAIASLARGDYGMAYDTNQVLCETWSLDEPSAVCDILNLLSGPLPSSEEKIRALIALATKRGDLLPDTLVRKLADTIEYTISVEGALLMFETEIYNQQEADWLVDFQPLQKHLRKWISAKRPDWEAAERLLKWARERIAWPPPWPSPNATVELELGIAKACDKLRWPADPFGPDRVEQETRPLEELWVTPPVWNGLRASGPVVLLSEPGAGQTFALRYLLQTHSEQWRNIQDRSVRTEPLLFPVLLDHEVLLRAQAQEEFVGEIAFSIGWALLDFLALNAFLFEQSTPPAQHAIGRLILACQHRLGELNGYVQRYLAERDQADSVVPLWLPDLLRGAAAGAQPVALYNPIEVWYALKDLRLATSQGFVVAVDIPARLCERSEAAWLARRLLPLVELIPELERRHVGLKLGLPAMLEQSLPIAAWSRSIAFANWSDEQLAALLKKRLERADGFDTLMDLGEDIILSQWLVQKAQGSPQRLMRLGNELLARFGNKGSNDKLIEQDLADVVSAVPQ